jgi:hypothetical protein
MEREATLHLLVKFCINKSTTLLSKRSMAKMEDEKAWSCSAALPFSIWRRERDEVMAIRT